MAIEKPDWAESVDWDDVESVRKAQDVYGQKVRRRTGDIGNDEVNIRRNGVLIRRLRELEPPIRIPTTDEDTGSSFRSLTVVTRALHIAEIHRDHARNATQSRDTGVLDKAQLSVHRLKILRNGHPDFVPTIPKTDT